MCLHYRATCDVHLAGPAITGKLMGMIMGPFRWKEPSGICLVQPQLSKAWCSLTQSIDIWRHAEEGSALHCRRALVLEEPLRLGCQEGTCS